MKRNISRARWAAIGAAVAIAVGSGVSVLAGDAGYTIPAADDIDVYEASVSVYQPLKPCRLLDTRAGNVPGSSPAEPYYRGIYYGEVGSSNAQGANWTTTNNIDVYFDPAAVLVGDSVTNNSIPSSIFGDCVTQVEAMPDTRVPTAIVANLTIEEVDFPSFITLYPADVVIASKPYISNITVYPPDNIAQMNELVIPLGAAAGADVSGDFVGRQAFRIYNEYGKGYVNVIIDVVGYYYNRTVVEALDGVPNT